MGTTVEAQAKPPAEAAAPPRVEKAPAEERRVAKVRSRKGEPQWFRVRVVDKGDKRSRLSVNLPLDLVRALGEDWPIEGCHHGHHTVGDVLRALDSGESLVDIDDGEATVRVWVK